ncbi:MAG: hypothetical protein JO001_04750 [Alphaproteobacteria bacterium]|nr:hypothetical protein [Alphaproteobacteria bacterium]
MKRQIATAVCCIVLGSAALGVLASSTLAIAQQKPAKACLESWRANRAANEANGLTQKAYMAQCRSGGASAASATPGASRGAGKDRPVYLTVKDLMQSIIDPSADALWNAVQTIADNEGLHEIMPKSQEDWADVRHAAVRLIEGSNLLMIPGREAAPAGDKSEAEGVELDPPQITVLIRRNRQSFNGFAKALQDLGVEALRATEAKDPMQIIDIGGRMENVCEGCHQTFWYPIEKHASAGN